jgi:hypothetical protein
MIKHRTLNVTATAALAIAAALASTSAGASTPTRPDANRHSTAEKFSIISTTDPSTDSIIATGLFTAGGTDHAGSKIDKIKLANGTFEIKHTGHAKSTLNAKTCLLVTKGKGTYVLLDGTGAYRGISGSGKYADTIRVVFRKTKAGACNENANPAALQYLVSGHGPASL